MARADAAASNRILVVLELSGGNDGLNTLVPYADDAYYRHRPKIGIRPEKLRKIDDHFGFNAGMAGFEKLYKDGKMAIVHGCGYAQPSFSHFTSMAYWHTGAPNSGEEYGWVGRLADAIDPQATPEFHRQHRRNAVAGGARARPRAGGVRRPGANSRARVCTRNGALLDHVPEPATGRQRLAAIPARGGARARARHRNWCARPGRSTRRRSTTASCRCDLPKVAALIAAGMPTRLYYTSYRNNAFDTHVQQADLHQRLLTYASDAVAGFMQDMERIGRADDVVVMVFSEFGRRVPENTSLGTDHGTANHMYVVGKQVKGGHYGTPPSLTELDEGDNLVFTTDFRRVYASVIEGWLGYRDTQALFSGRFETFPVFCLSLRFAGRHVRFRV